jgi:hypothetical protein
MKSAIISQGGFGFLKAMKDVITRGTLDAAFIMAMKDIIKYPFEL